MSPPESDASFDDDRPFHEQVSMLAMPKLDDDDDDAETDAGDERYRIPETRSAASSTASIEVEERLEALNRLNQDLARKLVEAERTLQTRLSDHEQELEDMQLRLEDAKSELSATKREEKELRSKEVRNTVSLAPYSLLMACIAPKHQPDRHSGIRDCEAPEESGHGALVVPESTEAVSGAMLYVHAVAYMRAVG